MQFKKLLFKALYSPKDILPSLNRILHTKRINTYKKKIHDANIVWHTCTPKSASTFFMNYCKSTLINSSKDSSRTKVIEMYPTLSNQLSKKKDVNKSDAILIARFYSETRLLDNN